MQQQLIKPSLAQVQKIDLAPDLLVSQCESGAIALSMTALASGYSQQTLAERVGKPREVLSRACNGRGGLDPDVLVKLMNESGSAFLLQYMAKQLGFVVKRDELEEKLADLDRQREEILAQRYAA